MVRILEDKESGRCVLYDQNEGWARGPVFESFGEVDLFLRWLKTDPRRLDDRGLRTRYQQFRHVSCRCGHLLIDHETWGCLVCPCLAPTEA